MKTEYTPLQQTIWNLAMTGGSVQWYGGHISKVNLQNIEEIFDNIKDVKPILRSFSKLTESVLDGKVPIDYFEIGDDENESLEYDFGNIKLIKKLEDIAKNNCAYDVQFLPYKAVEYLKSNHFNIENLPEGSFIEKSTILTT